MIPQQVHRKSSNLGEESLQTIADEVVTIASHYFSIINANLHLIMAKLRGSIVFYRNPNWKGEAADPEEL